MFRFANPEYLLLALLVPVFLILGVGRRRRVARAIPVSGLGVFSGAPKTRRQKVRPLVPALRALGLVSIVVALARPQMVSVPQAQAGEAVDVILVLDVSSSMASPDFQPLNRLEAAKQVIERFVEGRSFDRLGLIAFARHSVLKCPLTLDHGLLLAQLQSTEMAEGGDDGTAIGMALASAVNHLRRSPAKSKVAILLTDGDNNRSTIEPETGARMAETMGVTIHTIAVGKEIPGGRSENGQGVVDGEALERIAKISGGTYPRATDPQMLVHIFETIDRLERTPIEARRYGEIQELFFWPAMTALMLVAGMLVLDHTWLRRLP